MNPSVDTTLPLAESEVLEREPTRHRRKRRIPRSLVVGGGFVLLLVLIAIIGPLLAPYNPIDGTGQVSLGAPSGAHLMGTDLYGRDIFTRVLYGARLALGLSTACVLVALAFGTLWGMTAGFFGGWVETLLMRGVDIVISFPYVVLVIAVLAVLGPGLFTVFIAIAVVDWTTYARLIHSQVLSVREREYVEACRALGMPPARIMRRHILPNVVTAAIVYATLDISQVILTVSALNFLGLGVQPPTPDWGFMVNEGRSFIYTSWWISTFPGIAVMITGLAFSLLGDGLADALEIPR
ncbi:MAG TPA: ABC transporter permease [Chloroflexota bacterium]|nr:ABC transporter permease [Chloroflexota bacterium]